MVSPSFPAGTAQHRCPDVFQLALSDFVGPVGSLTEAEF